MAFGTVYFGLPFTGTTRTLSLKNICSKQQALPIPRRPLISIFPSFILPCRLLPFMDWWSTLSISQILGAYMCSHQMSVAKSVDYLDVPVLKPFCLWEIFRILCSFFSINKFITLLTNILKADDKTDYNIVHDMKNNQPS